MYWNSDSSDVFVRNLFDLMALVLMGVLLTIAG
jgi:hypothetical protein